MSVPSRITHSMMTNRMLGELQRTNAEINKLSNQISSQSKIGSPSDDPTGTHRALRLQSELDGIEGFRNGAQAATGWTQAAETALDSVTSLVHKARELIVQASNDTYNATDRAKVAGELGQILEQIKSAGNAKYGDQFVFSGQASGTAPYTAGASDAFAGDTNAVVRSIGPGQSVAVNVPGINVLGAGGGDGELLSTLRSAIADLNTATPASLNNLRTNGLSSLSANLDTVLTARSQMGTASNRATLALGRLDDAELTATTALKDVAGVDLAKAITSLSSQRTAYNAALQVGATVIQPSLMDFLR